MFDPNLQAAGNALKQRVALIGSVKRTTTNLDEINIEIEKLLGLLSRPPAQQPIRAQDKQTSQTEQQQTEDDDTAKTIGPLLAAAQFAITGAFVGFGLLGDKFLESLKNILMLPFADWKRQDIQNTPGPQAATSSVKQVIAQGEGTSIKQVIAQGEGTTDQRAIAEGFESGYDVPFSYGKYLMPEKNLTEMTLEEVEKFQTQQIYATKGKIGDGSDLGTSAVGKYQFLRGTLKELAIEAGFDPSTTKFTPEVQEQLADILIEKAVKDGKGDPVKIANNLANIWASLPTETGESFYQQPVGVSRQAVEAVLTKQITNNGEQLNNAGTIEEDQPRPQVVFIPVPAQKEGGVSPPPKAEMSSAPPPDTSGATRVLAGLNAID